MKSLLASLLFLVAFGFLGWLFGADLLADIQHRESKYAVARDITITEARCKSKLFVIAFCDFKLNGATDRKELNYFVLGGVSDEPSQCCARPTAAATSQQISDRTR